MATMSQNQAETQQVVYDPIMVVAASEEKKNAGSAQEAGNLDLTCATVAIWQVETDPAVQRGDFSGAWVVTPEGITGFAAEAEWIEDRQDPEAMIRTLLRYPVLLAPGTPRAPFEKLLGKGVLLIDPDATTAATHEEFAQARELFAEQAPGKRQPAWDEVPELGEFLAKVSSGVETEARDQTESDGESDSGSDRDSGSEPEAGEKILREDSQLSPAVSQALTTARNLREWLIEWNAFDKLRARRLGQANPLHSEPKGAPLR